MYIFLALSLLFYAPSLDPEAQLRQSIEFYKEGNFARAIPILEQLEALKDFHLHCSVKYNLARAYDKDNRFVSAKNKYHDYLQSCLESQSDQQAAREHLERLLKAHFSSINVTCVDQGLSLALDDLPPVACPTRFEDVLEGRHALKIKVGARSLLTRELEVKPGPTIDVQVPAFPQLFIKGSGAGEVLVGGLPVGRIGAPALIVAGEHAVVVRRPRCPDQAQSVTARPGERVYLTLGPCSTPSAASPGRGPWPWVLAGSSALFLGGGLLLYAKNQDAAKAGDQAQTELYYGLTLASYGLGGAALVGGLAWGLWPASPQSEAAYGLSWSGVW